MGRGYLGHEEVTFACRSRSASGLTRIKSRPVQQRQAKGFVRDAIALIEAILLWVGGRAFGDRDGSVSPGQPGMQTLCGSQDSPLVPPAAAADVVLVATTAASTCDGEEPECRRAARDLAPGGRCRVDGGGCRHDGGRAASPGVRHVPMIRRRLMDSRRAVAARSRPAVPIVRFMRDSGRIENGMRYASLSLQRISRWGLGDPQ